MLIQSMTALVLVSVLTSGAADSGDLGRDKSALEPLQRYVGDWRGVGQPRRGSTKGAWRERTVWVWQFRAGQARLSFTSTDGRYFRSGELRPAKQSARYQLLTETAAGQKVTFRGELDQEGRLILVAAEPPAGVPARLSLRQVADGNRLVVLYERRKSANRYSRLAEVGYTRQGSNFGKGTNYVECVVTGGLGTIPVSHQGKTYYVCCSGCRDYFDENPAQVLAEYRDRKAAERAERKATAKSER